MRPTKMPRYLAEKAREKWVAVGWSVMRRALKSGREMDQRGTKMDQRGAERVQRGTKRDQRPGPGTKRDQGPGPGPLKGK